MIIKKELIKRQIAGDTILVPVGQAVLESNGLFALNELAAFIWGLLPQAENAQEICDAVLAEYDVTEAEAIRDIGEFLAKLREMDIIE